MSEREKLEERSARKLIRQQAEEKAILEEALKDSPQTLQKILPKIQEQSTYGRQMSTLPEKRQATIEQAKKIEKENVLAAKKAKEEEARLAEEKKKAAEAAKIPAKPPVSATCFW